MTDVWQEEDKEDDEVGLRVVFTIEYEDDDVDDVGFRQLTAMTRGSKNLQGGYAKVAVVLDDELQDKEVIQAVRKAAADAGMNLSQDCLPVFIAAVATRFDWHDVIYLMLDSGNLALLLAMQINLLNSPMVIFC